MSSDYEPIVNRWFRHLDKGYEFQVVAVNEAERTVEIQHFDGDVEEMDLDAWKEMEIEPIEAPEDWTGTVDDVERDDLGYTETDMTGRDWSERLEEGRSRPRGWAEEEEESGEGGEWE